VRVPPSDLSGKLLIEPGYRCAVLNPPAGYLDRLHPLPDGASAGKKAETPADLVQLFVSDRAQLEREVGAALTAGKPGGVLWVTYPSAASGAAADLSRNHGWGVLNTAGLTATTEISVDGDWDALRFQPFAEVPGSAIPSADMLPVGRHASFAFRAVRAVALLFFHLLFRFDVKGRERIPDTAFVLICNHLGWMDAVSLLLIFPPEPRIHFLADPTSMMKNRPLWALVKQVGGIVPVDRANRADRVLFRQVGRCLERGGVVALFPEGDFGPREGQLLPFKKGFAHFAVDASVPVVPTAMTGMREIWLGKRLAVVIGEPILTAGRTVDEVHQLGEQAVTSLLPPYREPTGPKLLRRWLTGLF
jgi:1-acyl-sn-glycerol-3-phosphate acyltransferase